MRAESYRKMYIFLLLVPRILVTAKSHYVSSICDREREYKSTLATVTAIPRSMSPNPATPTGGPN